LTSQLIYDIIHAFQEPATTEVLVVLEGGPTLKNKHCEDSWMMMLEITTAGSCDPAEPGTVALKFLLDWDGRTLTATHTSKSPDIKTNIRLFPHGGDQPVRELADRLLEEERPFVTQFGEGETLRTLEWTIAW
jgi:hypothetical protein